MKRYNTLNEEMNRIKSLFTEERMFGNLINEQEENNDVPTKLMDCDKVEAFESEVGWDDWRKEKVTGLVKKCEDGKAAYVWSSKDGKYHGVYRSWELDNGKHDDTYFINDEEVSKEEYENIHSDVKLPKKDIEKTPEEDGTEEKTPEGETEEKTDTQKVAKSSKAGIGVEGEPFEKGDAKSDREEVKLDVKDTKGEIKLNAKQCVQGMKNAWKSLSSGGDKDEWVKNNADRIKNIEWCLSNFGNRFEKEKLFGATDEANKLIKHLELEKPKLVSGGAEGEKFIITNDRGRKRMVVKKVAPNKYRFRGFADISLFDRSSTKREKIFKPEYVGYIKKKLNLPDDTVITITKAVNTNKMDGGFFIIG